MLTGREASVAAALCARQWVSEGRGDLTDRQRGATPAVLPRFTKSLF